MKFVLVFLFITSIAKADGIPEWEFQTKQQQFQNCFKSYFCGSEKIPIPEITQKTDLEQKKKLFFNELAARCLAKMPDAYKVKYAKTIDNTIFSFDMLSDGYSNVNYVGCTPTRDFQKMIGSNCDDNDNNSYNSAARILEDTAQVLTDDLSYNDATTCSEDLELKPEPEGSEIKTLSSKRIQFGYIKKNGKCVPRCKDGEIFLAEAKKGMYSSCTTLSEDSQETSCFVYNKDGVVIGKKAADDDSSDLALPAKFTDMSCISCDDPKYFKDMDYVQSDHSTNECIDKDGCNRYQEYVFELQRCDYKCSKHEKRNKKGKCKASKDEYCNLFRDFYKQLSNWNYEEIANIAIQECSARQVFQSVSGIIKNKISNIESVLEACESPASYNDIVNQTDAVMIKMNLPTLKDPLAVELKSLKCFDLSKGGIPQQLHKIPINVNDLEVGYTEDY
jgi:hypothetical protein